MRRLCYLLLPIFLFLQSHDTTAQNVPENLTLKEIFHEPVIPGVRPQFRYFNATMDSIYFAWNDSSYFDTGMYKMAIGGSDPEFIEDPAPRPIHSPNNRRFVYIKDGNIYVANRDGSNPRRIVASQEFDYSPQWSPDSRKIAFLRSGDVWVTDVVHAELIQVTRKRSSDPNYSINSWAGNNTLILSQADNSGARTVYFPEYVDEFVTPGRSTRGIAEVTYFAANIKEASIDTLLTGYNRSSATGSFSGNYAVIDASDNALKERKMFVYNLGDSTDTVLFENTTEGWMHGTYREFAPRTDRLLFLSEQTGWNHLYLANLNSQTVTQLTEGDFEITWARWLSDREIIYVSNEADYGERHIFTVDVTNGKTTQLTDKEAYRYQFSLTPDRKKLIYAKTMFNSPYELFMMNLENPSGEIQLTNTVPERFHTYNWQTEQYVRFTGSDGETGLSMSVLYPQNYDESRQYPVVVFAHGAGSLQNVYKGWSNNYWREYMFHQFLLLHDYVVVEVDFRHSTGYGRKFREDVTNWMGKYETQDIVDGLDWLQNHTGGALDLDNVGIYGGSYGGFMALYAVTDQPDRFHAGAALRKVSNWRNYYHANPWYTLPRLGDPEEFPDHYDRSSPLTYASELEHPIILLHGLIDDNVGSQDAFQYAEELIQSGNTNFEMMIYPSERHGFTSPNSWYDEYFRIFEFFEKHLK